jgi:peptide/nickel transport system substrate-binding protein
VQITLVRNPHWVQATDQLRTALPERIVWQLSQDVSVISQRLVADTGDDRFAFGQSGVTAAQLAKVQGNPSIKARLVTSQAGALVHLALNTQKDPLTDPAVRKAFQYAVDKRAFQFAVAGSAELAGDPATTLITPGIAGREAFDLYQAPPTGDPDTAKKLLAAAGHPTGLKNLDMVVSSQDAATAQALTAALARAGIEASIRLLDDIGSTHGNYHLTLFSWQPDFPSPNANIEPLFASAEISDGGNNLSRYANPEVDRMIAQAQSTVDPGEAGRAWAAIDRRVMADSPIVPLIYQRTSFLHGSNVSNFYVPEFPPVPNYVKIGLIR